MAKYPRRVHGKPNSKIINACVKLISSLINSFKIVSQNLLSKNKRQLYQINEKVDPKNNFVKIKPRTVDYLLLSLKCKEDFDELFNCKLSQKHLRESYYSTWSTLSDEEITEEYHQGNNP